MRFFRVLLLLALALPVVLLPGDVAFANHDTPVYYLQGRANLGGYGIIVKNVEAVTFWRYVYPVTDMESWGWVCRTEANSLVSVIWAGSVDPWATSIQGRCMGYTGRVVGSHLIPTGLTLNQMGGRS